MSRLAYAIIVCLIIIMFLAGGALGAYVVSRDLNKNTEAVELLQDLALDNRALIEGQSVLAERQAQGAERGRLIQDGTLCLLRALSPRPGEEVPERLDAALCPEVDFDALHAPVTTTIPGG
jgi:hypothetical protein